MNLRKKSPFKKCPRCKTKCLIHSKKCQDCGLIFERLNYTSNKVAKKNLLKGRKNEVVMTNDWPLDAKKSTALLLSGFLGFTGAHNFYLGRFFRASFVFLGLLLALAMVFLSEYGLYETRLYETVRIVALVPGSSVLFLWFADFISIFLEKYKIPVSIDEKLYTIVESEKTSKSNNSKTQKNNSKNEENNSKDKNVNLDNKKDNLSDEKNILKNNQNIKPNNKKKKNKSKSKNNPKKKTKKGK